MPTPREQRKYEFDDAQNATFARLSSAMMFVAVAMLLLSAVVEADTGAATGWTLLPQLANTNGAQSTITASRRPWVIAFFSWFAHAHTGLNCTG